MCKKREGGKKEEGGKSRSRSSIAAAAAAPPNNKLRRLNLRDSLLDLVQQQQSLQEELAVIVLERCWGIPNNFFGLFFLESLDCFWLRV